MNKMFYTYIHKTADEGRAFYVGKGKGERATWPYTRNAHWNNVVAKHGGFVAEIVDSFDTEQEAFAHERFLIASLRIFGCRLANKTEGGDGVAGHRHTEETRRRISEARMGRRLSDETRRRMSASRTGKPVPALRVSRGPLPEEVKEKMRKPKSPQAKANMRAARAGQEVAVVCRTTGDAFRSVAGAVDWLRQNGFPKASKSAVTECCQGKRVRAYGLEWIYRKEMR